MDTRGANTGANFLICPLIWFHLGKSMTQDHFQQLLSEKALDLSPHQTFFSLNNGQWVLDILIGPWEDSFSNGNYRCLVHQNPLRQSLNPGPDPGFSQGESMANETSGLSPLGCTDLKVLNSMCAICHTPTKPSVIGPNSHRMRDAKWNVFPLILLACSVDTPFTSIGPICLCRIAHCASRPTSCVDWARGLSPSGCIWPWSHIHTGH